MESPVWSIRARNSMAVVPFGDTAMPLPFAAASSGTAMAPAAPIAAPAAATFPAPLSTLRRLTPVPTAPTSSPAMSPPPRPVDRASVSPVPEGVEGAVAAQDGRGPGSVRCAAVTDEELLVDLAPAAEALFARHLAAAR